MRSRAPGLLRRHHDFRLLWTGQTVSQFGSQVTLLALPLVAIRQLHASTFAVGLLTTAEFAGFPLVGLPAGAWVDRMHRRPVLVAADVGRALALASVPVAAMLDVLTMAQLYAVALVMGVLTVFFDVAYLSYLPALVGRDDLVDGNARLEMSRSTAQVAGPGLGGGLVQVMTAPYAVLVDAVSFVVSALSVGAIRGREGPLERPPGGPRLRQEIGEGLRYVLGHPILRSLAVSVATFNLFSATFDAVCVVFLARTLHLSAGVIGLLFTVSALGSLTGAVLTGPISRRLGSARTIWVAPLLTYPWFLLVPLTTRGVGLLLFVVGTVVAFAGTVVFNVGAVSFRQAICPPRLLGRMTASMRFLSWGTPPLGGLLGGWLGGRYGVRSALWVSSVGVLLSVPWLVWSPLRGMRDLPAADSLPLVEPEPRPVVLPGRQAE
jgi:MFS family permease